MDNTAENLIRLCEAFAERTNRAVSTVSRIATGSGGTVERLKGGGRITTDRVARAIKKIDDLWPSDRPWPSDIPRPSRDGEEDAA